MKCEVCNTTDNIKTRTKNNMFGMILCVKHYKQLYNHGKILVRTIYDENKIIKLEDYAELITFDKYGNKSAVAKIDLEDVEIVSKYKWTYSKGHYIKNELTGTYLHRYLLNYKGRNDVDHKNRDKLDYRKSNLRIVTHQQNSINKKIPSNNKSKIIGVMWDKSRNKWRAEIKSNGQKYYLGRFADKDSAIRARLEAELHYFKEYSPQRHLFEEYSIVNQEKPSTTIP